MIERVWLESQKQLVVEYYDNNFLNCRLDKRKIQLSIDELSDCTNATNILLLENDIILFSLEREVFQMNFAKELINDWLIKKKSHIKIVELYENIVQADIYGAYTRGEESMIEYYWNQVKAHFQEMPKDVSNDKLKLIEALELCIESNVLKKIIPYISLGRLCLSNTKVGQSYSYDCFCMGYLNNKFEVANYEHKVVKQFDKASEAVGFIENFYTPSIESSYSQH
jgi:hypothetical protein